MADEQPRRQLPGRPRSGQTPPSHPGWRVTPAPDGRGGQTPQSPRPRRNQRLILIGVVVALLAINLWVSSQALSPNSRVQIPYLPTFWSQLEKGNVSSISSTSGAVQGTLRSAIRYPASSSGAPSTIYFSTQIPSFANNTQLFSELQKEHVTVNAKNPNQGASFLTELIFGFGPTLLLVLLFVFLMRRAPPAVGPVA